MVSSSVADAKQRLKRDQFDIVLSDYELVDGTAFDLFDSLPGEFPVVIITGTGCEEIAVEAMKKGATDYIIKDPDNYYLKTLSITVDKALKAKTSELALKKYQKHLEDIVKERTKQHHLAVEKLKGEIDERKQTEKNSNE